MDIKFGNVQGKRWYVDQFWRINFTGYLLFLLFPFFVFIDIGLCIMNYILFRFVNITVLKRSDYIKPFSRWKLPHKSFKYRLGCVYCSYANGLMYFGKDLVMSLEFLYCPWKQKQKTKIEHHQIYQEWEND